jgi:hypothetical protein
MENLAHSASFHSGEKIAPSKSGIKHLIAHRAVLPRLCLADNLRASGEGGLDAAHARRSGPAHRWGVAKW